MKPASVPQILYVDDDTDDCLFLCESFAASTERPDLVCAPGGEEAIDYLNSIEPAAALPSLIILDLNMPRWDGRKTLNYLKSSPRYQAIPVVILSTSGNKTDREACTQLGAASYLQKPYHYQGYQEVVNSCLPLMRIRD